MDAKNLANIPEIVLSISSHLDILDLVQCVRVCKAWNKLFISSIWNEVTIAMGSLTGATIGPKIEDLKAHRELICKLEVFDSSLSCYSAVYPKLRSLSLGPSLISNNPDRGSSTEFIALNPTLEHLKITNPQEILNEEFWKAVSKVQKLLSLRLEFTQPLNGNDDFWSICRNLELLHLRNTCINIDTLPKSDTLFENMCYLEFSNEYDCPEYLEIIRRSPNVKGLTWMLPSDSQVLKALAEIIQKGSFRMLEILDLGQDFGEEEISCIINGLQRISELTLSCGNFFGMKSFRSLHRHFSSLVNLNLFECEGATSPMLNEVMCSAVNLKLISGNCILAQDIIQEKPWVCHSLESFRMAIAFPHSSDPQHPVFKQLSILTKLEYLCLDPPDTMLSFLGCFLNLRLSDGLGELKTITNLTHISVENSRQDILVNDVYWMLDNWKNLEHFIGDLNKDRGMNKLLRNVLFEQGIF